MTAVAPDLGVSKCPFHGAAPDAALTPSGCLMSARAAAFDPFEDGYVHPPSRP
ncbi:hypothetical protein SAMN05414139_03885 [Burkholderia sp. D7]|nr:hypothetical protein SAMN05414139_03885 [Burkholderia sp. D7]